MGCGQVVSQGQRAEAVGHGHPVGVAAVARQRFVDACRPGFEVGLLPVVLLHAHRIDVPGPSIDIVGSGGDRMHSVNISTMASIVVALPLVLPLVYVMMKRLSK